MNTLFAPTLLSWRMQELILRLTFAGWRAKRSEMPYRAVGWRPLPSACGRSRTLS